MNYNGLTLHYFRNAPGAGVLTGPGVFRGAAGNKNHGIWVQFDLEVRGQAISAARFLAFACPHTIAASAWVVEQAIDLAVGVGLPATTQQLSERFAVPIEKRGRLLIIEDAWTAAMCAARRQ
ncbi:MAG: iron-sulfur cluster assembly scaffold protein [Pseudomonadota bacterium]|nr:iron-sulfur cluster assembly scaffold protein [Pseudomonadota bacterium]